MADGTIASGVSLCPFVAGELVRGRSRAHLPANDTTEVGTHVQVIPAVDPGQTGERELYIGGSWKWLSAKYSYAVTDYFGLNDSVARMTQSKDCFMAVAGACAGTRAGFLAASNENRGSSKGTGYFQIDASYEFAPKWTVTGHVGKASIKNYSELNYTDVKVGVTYDLSGWVLGGAVVGTNANKQWYAGQRAVAGANNTKDLGNTTLVLSVAKTF